VVWCGGGGDGNKITLWNHSESRKENLAGSYSLKETSEVEQKESKIFLEQTYSAVIVESWCLLKIKQEASSTNITQPVY